MDYSYLDRNVGEIKERIRAAAARSGRDEAEITLLAATKSAEPEEINYIHEKLGISVIGENRVQQLTDKWDKLNREGLDIHFIGSLQSNKVKYLVDKVSLIHSLDSHSLASEIDRQAKKHGKIMSVLLEVNSGGEEQKGGVGLDEISEFCRSLEKYQSIKLCGFMTMAPKCENVEDYRLYFNKTREACERAWFEVLGRTEKPILSMGMSESFEIAVECGANLVRVGRRMFSK